jgi:DNA modification methylase
MNHRAKLFEQFATLVGRIPVLNASEQQVLDEYLASMQSYELQSSERLEAAFYESVNKKLKLNNVKLSSFFSACAAENILFNFQEKELVTSAFDRVDLPEITALLERKTDNIVLAQRLLHDVRPLSRDETRQALDSELNQTLNRRTGSVDPTLTEPLVLALFGSFLFAAFTEEQVHGYFDPLPTTNSYEPSYWRRLHSHAAGMFKRDNTLTILDVRDAPSVQQTYESIRQNLFHFTANTYNELTNHGHLAIFIPPTRVDGRDVKWELAADLCLFAEKHRQVELDKGYFKQRSIKEATSSYIPELDLSAAKFELVNEGFAYKDTFVIFAGSEGSSEPTLLLLFQKNERDETPLPCPSCRSHNVLGNSYPTFGVKSWECQNWICPDRSMSNRGKRFSFLSLLMQEAIHSPTDALEPRDVRRWSRDVAFQTSIPDCVRMLSTFYSLSGDTLFMSSSVPVSAVASTRLTQQISDRSWAKNENANATAFFEGAFFNRFAIRKAGAASQSAFPNLGDHAHQVYCGDSFEVLKSCADDTFHAGVTSPPYYNARQYSTWSNVYCYLYDMYNIACEIFRTMKPGGFFLYNIFDYFDNENIVALSAMGKKRLILSSYSAFLFRRAGFEIIGNIVWDKGDIEGKRAFNGGNFSPYYQAPFNCWEHIWVFRKPDTTVSTADFPRLLRQSPVFKMRGGVNTYGHTAPYPEAIPTLIISRTPPNALILDPFAGSLTSGRTAEKLGRRGFSIEKHLEYCELGLRLRNQGELFLN